jgi:uncharacterized protein (TIGR02147 family)
MQFERETYRSFLKQILADKIGQNPSFSMHAFAAKVGVAQGFLSEVMSGKKNLSSETAAKIALRLDLPPQDSDYFTLLVQLERAKDAEYREKIIAQIEAIKSNEKVFDLTVDAFKTISEWYHFPIIDLTEMEEFEFTSKNVAKRLGISTVEVEAALERLLRLELLELTSKGEYKKTKDHFLIESPAQNEAVVRFHRQILERLSQALPVQKKDQRLSRTEVLLIDPKMQSKVEAIIDNAAKEVIALAMKSKKKSRVCALALHFFNLVPERK